MIKTGDWDVHDLIRYLVAVEGSLTQTEIERLKETVAFPKEESEVQANAIDPIIPPRRKYRAQDLFEPSPALRELGLPILAWAATTKWKPSSDEGIVVLPMYIYKKIITFSYSQVSLQTWAEEVSRTERTADIGFQPRYSNTIRCFEILL